MYKNLELILKASQLLQTTNKSTPIIIMGKLQFIAGFILVFGYMWPGSNSLYSPQEFVVEEPRASLVRTFLRGQERDRPGLFSDLDFWLQPISNEERHRQLIKKGDQSRQDQIRAMENMIIRTVRDKKKMSQLLGTVVKEIKNMNQESADRFDEEQGLAKPVMFSNQLSDQSR